MQAWLWAAIFAVLAWALQRLLSKVALADLGTRKFYLLSTVVSLLVYLYLPYVLLRPPAIAELLPAFGLACLMAVTFGVTTEAIRRGRLGTVSPITALSPALSATLGLAVLGERADWPVYLGIALAPAGVILLSLSPSSTAGERGWLALALLSLLLQGVGAFQAKLVVAPAGPSALLLLGAAVQVLVGLFLAPPSRWSRSELRGRPTTLTVITYAIGATATIGYLLALAQGPVVVVVPLAATSPALAGLLGVLLLKEAASRRQVVGIGLAFMGAVLLSASGSPGP